MASGSTVHGLSKVAASGTLVVRSSSRTCATAGVAARSAAAAMTAWQMFFTKSPLGLAVVRRGIGALHSLRIAPAAAALLAEMTDHRTAIRAGYRFVAVRVEEAWHPVVVRDQAFVASDLELGGPFWTEPEDVLRFVAVGVPRPGRKAEALAHAAAAVADFRAGISLVLRPGLRVGRSFDVEVVGDQARVLAVKRERLLLLRSVVVCEGRDYGKREDERRGRGPRS